MITIISIIAIGFSVMSAGLLLLAPHAANLYDRYIIRKGAARGMALCCAMGLAGGIVYGEYLQLLYGIIAGLFSLKITQENQL